MTDSMNVFDRRSVRAHRDRAAPNLAAHDYLFAEVADRLAERLDDMRRSFPLAVALGARGDLAGRLAGRSRIETVVMADLSPRLLAAGRKGVPQVACDEEALPFAPASLDLVAGCLTLHWVNDLPGALVQIRRALKPDGLFLAALFGGDTLFELRRAFLEAEAAEEGGASPRTSPATELADAASLLQRAGFALPVADIDTITVTQPDAFALMRDLRGMGESGASHARRKSFTRRATLFAAAERYRALHGDAQGRVPATFQVIFLTGWSPHAAQPKPLRPGAAQARLADALGAEEKPAGDAADPRRGGGTD
jgi:NADH dehydrogenase [ubiquinone] 1 alpha subcomplex assembly factor 5